MGSEDVKKENSSYLVRRPAISNNADIKNINSQSGFNNNIFGTNFSDLGVSRISPSNYNIGSNVSKIDMKNSDVFSIAYGNSDSKYFNTGYDLSDKYCTHNYLQSYNQKSNFWDKLANFMGKTLMIGGLVTAGVGLVSGIMSLFSKDKSPKTNESSNNGEQIKVNEKQDKSEEIKVDNTAAITKAINDGENVEIKSPSDLDGLELGALVTYRDNLQNAVDDMKAEYASIDSNIAGLETEKESLTAQMKDSKKISDEKQKAAGVAQSDLNKAGKYKKECEDAVTKIQGDVSDLSASIVKKEGELAQLKAAGQDTSALQTEINTLKAKRETAKNALTKANENAAKAKLDFEAMGKTAESLSKVAESAKSDYESIKAQIKNIETKIDTLKTNKKEYPKKIGEKEALVATANVKIQEKENSPV